MMDLETCRACGKGLLHPKTRTGTALVSSEFNAKRVVAKGFFLHYSECDHCGGHFVGQAETELNRANALAAAEPKQESYDDNG